MKALRTTCSPYSICTLAVLGLGLGSLLFSLLCTNLSGTAISGTGVKLSAAFSPDADSPGTNQDMMRDTQMITFNFKIIVEIANGGDAVKQVVYMHKFRERGFIRRPTYVAYLATKLPRFPYHQQQWMDPRTLQNWINRQDNQFNHHRFSMQPTSDPSLQKYSEVSQRGPEEMLWTAQRDPLDNWMMDQTVTKSSDKDIKKREEEENNKTQNNFSPVAPGTPIILWRDLERKRKGEPSGFNATSSLGYCPQGIPNEEELK